MRGHQLALRRGEAVDARRHLAVQPAQALVHRRLDAAGEDSYLETDKPENVALYSRFGFEVIDQAEVLGVANWFMWRRAGVDAPATRGRTV